MRKLLLSFVLLLSVFSMKAQTVVATFDTLQLPQADTFYVNYSDPGNDVGFDDGYIHFPCVYDTAFGYNFWSSGFAYSNMTDSVTSGYSNQYSAKTGIGYNNSPNYLVAYGTNNNVSFQFMPIPVKGPVRVIKGFYITNSTYAYNSMRDGDAFAKKFGGATGNDPDWFKLTIHGYQNGVQGDSVDFYLADFRDANNANDYIVKDWRWVALDSLGYIDSLDFVLSSSDNGQFGMNTPAYFCMDDFTTQRQLSVSNISHQDQIKIYPNPATDHITIDLNSAIANTISVMDMTGKLLKNITVNSTITTIPINDLANGMYLLELRNNNQRTSVRFIKR